jgi:hypothetical protein
MFVPVEWPVACVRKNVNEFNECVIRLRSKRCSIVKTTCCSSRAPRGSSSSTRATASVILKKVRVSNHKNAPNRWRQGFLPSLLFAEYSLLLIHCCGL